MTWPIRAAQPVRAWVVALLIVHDGATAWGVGAQPTPGTSRVRSTNPVIATAIDDATAHSGLFRSIVESIEATDGIVYVRNGTCRLGVRGCLEGIHKAGPVRFVHIKVDTRKASGCALMAVIGHELQHALEVLRNPKIISQRTLAQFYLREGPTGDDDRFETESAVRAGLLVEKEVGQSSICRP